MNMIKIMGSSGKNYVMKLQQPEKQGIEISFLLYHITP